MLLSWILLIQQVFKILLPSFPHSLLIPQHHPTSIFNLLHVADVFCCIVFVLCYPINLLLPFTVSSSSHSSLAASALATATAFLPSFFFLWYSTLSACSLVCSHRFFNSFFSFSTSCISSFHHHSSLSVLGFPDVSPSTSLATFLSTLALFSHQPCTPSSVVVNLFSSYFGLKFL